jgi:hypothetical protein
MDMGGMMGGAFGAVGSIVGASIAADAQKYTANTNWSIALMNYYARERERFQAQIEASRIEAKQDLGQTDAKGNTTKFVPGVGWVQELAPAQKALQARQDSEQMAQFGDLAKKRRHMDLNLARQAKEADYGNALFDEMKTRAAPTAGEIERLITGAQATGTNRAFDDTAKIASRQALRTGTNPSGILSEIARQRGKELGNIGGAARTQAMSLAPQLEDQEEKMKANLYNLFATRASANPEASFSPIAIDTGGLSQAANRDMSGGLKAAMMEGGRLPYQPVNYGPANLAGAIGAAGQGFMRNMQNSRGGGTFNEGGANPAMWDVFSDEERNRRGYGSFAGAP